LVPDVTSTELLTCAALLAAFGVVLAGSILGLCILAFSWAWSGISLQVGAAVAIALPVRAKIPAVLGACWAARPVLAAAAAAAAIAP
jgi:hypothetical protein